MSASSLSRTFSQGVAWFYFLRLFSRLTATVQIMIVARLLDPKIFGLMGIATLLLSLLEVLSATGNTQAIIQKKKDITGYLDAVWWVEVGRGVVLGVLIFLGAPLIAAFFKTPEAIEILRVMALIPFLNGLASPGLAALNKELRFRRLVLFQVVQSILGATFTILVAYWLRSVWALVAAALFGAVVASLGSFLIHPYRPGRQFSFQKAGELWGFGRWVLVNKILHYLFNDGDDWVVGRLLGAGHLGFYQMAYNLGNAPSTEVTNVFSHVAFPAFSRIQDDPERIRSAYLRIMQIVMFLSTPISVGIWLVAADANRLFLGEKWAPMVASLQVLLIWGWLRSFRATIGPILQARGRPDQVAQFTLFKVVILAVLVIPFTLHNGILGTSWAVVLAAFSEIPLLFRGLHRNIQIRYSDLIQAILRPLLPAIPMIFTVLFLQRRWLAGSNEWLRLAVSILAGALLYLALSAWLDHKFHWNVRADIQQAIGANLQPFSRILRLRRRSQLS